MGECIQKLVPVPPSGKRKHHGNNGAGRAWQHPEQVIRRSGKRDGDYYQRESLKVMQSAIEKYLKEKNYPPSIVRSREFHKKSPTRRQFLWTRRNYHHWFLSMASNSKVKCTRPWDLILIFRQLVLQDFHQVVPYSSSTAWKLRRRIIPAVLTIFSPKRTRCLSHNRRRSEGLILLSQTTRISLWRRLFLQ